MRELRRILLVDDDPDLLALATEVLAGSGGYTVKACASAGEAVAQSLSFRPDLILLEVLRPGTDGFATVEALRALEATAETPIVLMAAKAQGRETARSEELGCLGLIPKPFDPATLTERLEALWGVHRRRLAGVYQREFEALRLAYVGELPEKLGAMRAAAALLAAQGWDRPALESLFHLTHRMAGASGLYRLRALSRSAGALEDVIRRLLSGPAWPPSSTPLELATRVEAMARTARGETQRDPLRPRARGRRR